MLAAVNPMIIVFPCASFVANLVVYFFAFRRTPRRGPND